MTKCLKNSRGQFAPIAAMVVFTIVVFIFAVINIYQVAKTKLRLQNIADAVALNLAAREASSLNFVADRNEWLNHLYSTPNLNTDPSLSNGQCPNMYKDTSRLPGLSCVDSRISGFSFPSVTGAIGYARLIQSVNDSQILAVKAYDTFMGANSGVGQKALENILLQDIPDLRTDPTIRLITWNSNSGQNTANTALKNAQTNPASYFSASTSRVLSTSEAMTNALNEKSINDVHVDYDGRQRLTGTIMRHAFPNVPLHQLLNTQTPIGWMAVNQDALPSLNVGSGNTVANRLGAGAIVLKPVTILGVTFAVSARAVAYVVPGSGSMPVSGPLLGAPVFLPTYWVKLVNSHE